MQSLQSVLFTLINHEAVTGTIRMTQLFTHHSSHSQRRTPAGHMTVGEGIQQTCRLGCYLVKARSSSFTGDCYRSKPKYRRRQSDGAVAWIECGENSAL